MNVFSTRTIANCGRLVILGALLGYAGVADAAAPGPCYGGSFDALGRPTVCAGVCTDGPIVGCDLITVHVPFEPGIKYCDCGTVSTPEPVDILEGLVNIGFNNGNLQIGGDVDIAGILVPITQTGSLTVDLSTTAANGANLARFSSGIGGTTISIGDVTGTIGEVLYIESPDGNRFSMSLLDVTGSQSASPILQEALDHDRGALSISIGMDNAYFSQIDGGQDFSENGVGNNFGIVATSSIPEPATVALTMGIAAVGFFALRRRNSRG